jgi:hypothetical protein
MGMSKELLHQIGLKRSRQQSGAMADELFGVSGGFADEELQVFRGVVQARALAGC